MHATPPKNGGGARAGGGGGEALLARHPHIPNVPRHPAESQSRAAGNKGRVAGPDPPVVGLLKVSVAGEPISGPPNVSPAQSGGALSTVRAQCNYLGVWP